MFRSLLVRGLVLFVALCGYIDSSANPATRSVLIPTNGIWKYLDNGSIPDPSWTMNWFNDSDWPSGPAELGYGDDEDGRPEATTVSFGSDADNRHITTYFRHSFASPEADRFASLKLRLLRDDGAVVYLNGVEVLRSRMPSGPIEFDTLALLPELSGPDETEFIEQSIDPFLLFRDDLNVIAVEVHQAAANSPDLSFALELAAEVDEIPLTLTRGPYLQSGTRTSVVVRWRTSIPTTSQVRYGPSPDQLLRIAGNLNLTTNHSVTLAPLNPDTRYYYAIGTTTNILAGGPGHYFTTAPATAKPTRVWALGDCGTAAVGRNGSRLVRDAYYQFAGNREPDVWIMLGDNAYNWGEDAEYQVAVFETYHEMLPRCVLWSTMGNHETYSFLNPYPNIPYFEIFTLPTAGEAGGVPSGTEHYYSLDYGNIHFVCLDSEESIRQPTLPMLRWLEQDLAANTNDWTIVFWHSPPYTKGSHDSDRVTDSSGRLFQMRTNVVPILEAYGVDLVLNGHSHSYERSYPLRGHYGRSTTLQPEMILDAGSGQEDDTGPYLKPFGEFGDSGVVYIVAGSSGWATFLTGLHPAMYVTHLRMGSLILDIDGKRLDAKFLRETGAIDDSFTIIKDAPPAPFRIVRFWSDDWETVLRWKSVAGRSYRVDECSTLNPKVWTPLSEAIVATGVTTSWTNEFPAPANSRFYRVVELESPEP